MTWYYASFVAADSGRFLGGCYVRAIEDPELEAQAMILATELRGDGTTLDDGELGSMLALAAASRLGINPGGEASILGPIPDEAMDEHVPPEDRERLLSREEVERGQEA